MKNIKHNFIKPLWISIYGMTLFFAIISCDENDNGNILVTVKHDNTTIGQATIYLKAGTLTNPNIPLKEYDRVQRADGTGQAHFSDLVPGDYFLYAIGYFQNQQVEGSTSISVKARSNHNTYKITIQIN